MPWAFLTVTSTQRGTEAFGGTTVSVGAEREGLWPTLPEPNVTDAAFVNPPSEMVMAPPLPTGPVLGLTAATEGQPVPSPPCRALKRFWSLGVPRPLAASKPGVAG